MVQPVPERAQEAAAASAAAPSFLRRLQHLLTRRNVPFNLSSHRPVISYNADSHSKSVRMLYTDYEAVEQPAKEVLSRPGAGRSGGYWGAVEKRV